jgi:hypothetical protein
MESGRSGPAASRNELRNPGIVWHGVTGDTYASEFGPLIRLVSMLGDGGSCVGSQRWGSRTWGGRNAGRVGKDLGAATLT